jgi:hypothetical protein
MQVRARVAANGNWASAARICATAQSATNTSIHQHDIMHV